jgi:hypothetical protein
MTHAQFINYRNVSLSGFVQSGGSLLGTVGHPLTNQGWFAQQVSQPPPFGQGSFEFIT